MSNPHPHSWSAQPPHLQFNPFVKVGYRPHGRGVAHALSSIFMLHNETANIVTHLFGFIVCVYWLAFSDHADDAPHYYAVRFSDACSAACFFGSVVYHTAMSATSTAAQYNLLLAFDMVGVVVANLGAALSLAWLSAPCAPLAVKLGIGLAPSVCALSWVLCCARSRESRAKAVGLQWLMRVLFIIGAAAAGEGHWPLRWLLGTLLTDGAVLFGAVVNVLRFPERWVPHSPLVAYALQSHTIMHVSVGAALLWSHHLWLWRCEELVLHPGLRSCADTHAAALLLG